MGVTITGRYLGDLRCEAVHGPSGNRLLTDAPLDNEGKGELFSPTDLIATALGTCILTILGIVARRRGVSIEGATFTVEKSMVADPKRRIAKLETTITLPAALGDVDRKALEHAGHTCPIDESLKECVEVPIRFAYR